MELWHVEVKKVVDVFIKDDIVQKLKEKKMISKIKMIKSKNEIKHEIEYQNQFNLLLLISRRKKWVDIIKKNNKNINQSFHWL